MAGLADLVASKIALANSTIQDLEPVVMHHPWIGQDMYGTPSYATAVARRGLVNRDRKQKMVQSGVWVMTAAVIEIYEPIEDTAPNANQDRVNPVDPRDLFILSDGTTAPIVDIDGLENPATSRPFYQIITLGNVV